MNEETTITREEHSLEAGKWHRTNADPEAYATSGGYGLALVDGIWSACFTNRATVIVLDAVEQPEEVPPFCWARRIIAEVQGKRQYRGWSEKGIHGKPGEENTDVTVPRALIEEARERKARRAREQRAVRGRR